MRASVMSKQTSPVDLASVPGQYLSTSQMNLAPGVAAGDRCEVQINIPEPSSIGVITLSLMWFIPGRRRSKPFWRIDRAWKAVKVTSHDCSGT